MELYRPPLLVLLPEGADRALRERHAVRAPHARPGDEQAAAEFAALLAAQALPVLVDGGRTVVEASIIIEHLDLHHPGPVRLIPEDRARRARRADDGPLLRQLRHDADAEDRRSTAIRAAERSRPPRRRRGARRCSTRRIAGSTAGWPAANGRRATPSASPTAPPRRRCSTPTGRTRSARHFANVHAYRRRLLARPSFARAVDEARPYRQLFPLGAPDRD